MRRFFELASVTAVAGTAVVTAAATASAATPSSLSIDGDLQPVPGVTILHITADGQQQADGTTTGSYDAQVQLAGRPTPISVSGPVTCISTNGNTASLVYPIDGMTPINVPPPLKGVAAVQITVTRGTNGQPSMVGVNGPMPTSSFKGCAPGPTPFVFNGSIGINGS